VAQVNDLCGAYRAIIAQLLHATSLELSTSPIAKDHPASVDANDRFSVLMPSGGASIERDDMLCTQRVEVWFVQAIPTGKHVEAFADALDTEQSVITAMHDRDWHDLPIEWVQFVSTTRQTQPDGQLFKFGMVFDVATYFDPAAAP